MIERIARTAAVACVILAAGAAVWTRAAPAPLGVLGGGLLMGLSFWAIKGAVDAVTARASARAVAAEHKDAGERGRKRAAFHLVKFFTRHGMLALAAYVMMVRLHLDPVGLLAGVSSLGIAVAVEGLRELRWRRFP